MEDFSTDDYISIETAEADLFSGRDPVPSFLRAYGFEHDADADMYSIRKPLPGIDGFEVSIEIGGGDWRAFGRVFDTGFGGDYEYVLFRIASSRGVFVEEVREAYKEVLSEIRLKCSAEPDLFLDVLGRDGRASASESISSEDPDQDPGLEAKSELARDAGGQRASSWIAFVKESDSFQFETGHAKLPLPKGGRCQAGDIVFAYVGAPVNAILWKCEAMGVADGNVFLSVVEAYTSREYTKSFLARYGVKSVRGFKALPALLELQLP